MKKRKQRQKTSIRLWLAILMLYGVPAFLYLGGFITTWFSSHYYTPLYRHGTPLLEVPLNFLSLGVVIWVVIFLYYIGLAAAYKEQIVRWPWQRPKQPTIIPWHILLLISLIGSLYMGVGISSYLNSSLDSGPMQSFTSTVIERESRYKRRGGMHYELRLTLNPKPTSHLILPVREAEYNAYPEGTRLVLQTKPGKLGQEWVVGMQPLEAGK